MPKTHRQIAIYHTRKATEELRGGSRAYARDHLVRALVEMSSSTTPILCPGEIPQAFRNHEEQWMEFERRQIRKWFIRSSWLAFRYYRTEEEEARELRVRQS